VSFLVFEIARRNEFEHRIPKQERVLVSRQKSPSLPDVLVIRVIRFLHVFSDAEANVTLLGLEANARGRPRHAGDERTDAGSRDISDRRDGGDAGLL
jgi:hypothetical protein